MVPATLKSMDVTDTDIARIPRRNVRVPVDEFAHVWLAAERRSAEQGARGVWDWYAAGVAITCRWMGTAIVRSERFGHHPAPAPVTRRKNQAYEELIEAEFLAAEKLDMRRPRPAWLADRMGWSESICATLRWAWRRSGPAPLQLETVEQR